MIHKTNNKLWILAPFIFMIISCTGENLPLADTLFDDKPGETGEPFRDLSTEVVDVTNPATGRTWMEDRKSVV